MTRMYGFHIVTEGSELPDDVDPLTETVADLLDIYDEDDTRRQDPLFDMRESFDQDAYYDGADLAA